MTKLSGPYDPPSSTHQLAGLEMAFKWQWLGTLGAVALCCLAWLSLLVALWEFDPRASALPFENVEPKWLWVSIVCGSTAGLAFLYKMFSATRVSQRRVLKFAISLLGLLVSGYPAYAAWCVIDLHLAK